MDDSKEKEIAQRYKTIEPFLNERTRRIFTANEALAAYSGANRTVNPLQTEQ